MTRTFTIKNNTKQLVYVSLNCVIQNDLEPVLFSSMYISQNTSVDTRAYCSDKQEPPPTFFIQFWKPDTLSGKSIGKAKLNMMDSTVSENNTGFDILISDNVITISGSGLQKRDSIDILFIILIVILLIGGGIAVLYFWKRKEPQQPKLFPQQPKLFPQQSIIQNIGTNFM